MTYLAVQAKTHSIAVGIILFVGIFYIATIREGYYWRSDSSLYIAHAKNVAEGRQYQATGFIYNSDYPSYSPRMYPPVVPMLLAPMYKIFGIDTKVMKIEIICTFMLFLGCMYATFRNKLTTLYMLSLIAIVGFNPFFWVLKDEILSDIPFVLFCYIAVFLIDRFDEKHVASTFIGMHPIIRAVLLGIALYATYGSRTVGVILTMCFVLYAIVKQSYTFRSVAISVATCGVFAALQNIIVGKDGSYLEQFKLDDIGALVYDNITFYIQEFAKIWSNNHNKDLATALFVCISICAIIGYIYSVKYKFSFVELFVFCYSVVILVWPANQDRFLTPLIPAYIFFALKGIEVSTTILKRYFSPSFAQRSGKYIDVSMIFLLVLVVGATYIGVYTTAEYKPIPGVNTPKSQELFTYIRKSTSNDAVLLGRDPRTLALFTSRKASVYARTRVDQESWSYIKAIQATYIVVGGFGKEERFQADQEYLYPFIQTYRRNFDRVFDNGSFKVYKVRSYAN